jgi:uncharacterized protein (UPF0218 family)
MRDGTIVDTVGLIVEGGEDRLIVLIFIEPATCDQIVAEATINGCGKHNNNVVVEVDVIDRGGGASGVGDVTTEAAAATNSFGLLARTFSIAPVKLRNTLMRPIGTIEACVIRVGVSR